ncbi:acyl carrier protein [Streptomyces sp. ET3-23]|uniref:acyl carrier protein n=1 Tax=Streptomyces sp. ET3-23 TaxID=2885643 RepID=UPI001D0FEF6E|nr:acyl carrier protein [Streptomyces sp. ET3-23]MCC2280755.1 acyl carrier protein [Streptomyces sp. ET3-23]
MTGKHQVAQTIHEILTGPLDIAPECIRPETRLPDLGLDSLAYVELAVLISSAFGVEIDDEELRDVSVEQLTELVEQRRATA